ncbi:hypothetical protein TNCV_2648781 [Trichonephila clavipes]|nr:hypothetical protein TNCV_2648781 [Trichonephila clavipes]
MHSKSLDFFQEQARIKAKRFYIQSHSSPHHAVCCSHLGSGGSYSPEKDCTLFKTFNCVEQQTHLWFVRNEVLHRDLNVPPLLEFIKKQSENFFNRLAQISNESIREIPAYDNSIPSSSKRPRAVLITRINTYQP